MAPWRWWDGTAWTVHVSGTPDRRHLPDWISVPVILASLFVVPGIIALIVMSPLSVLLSIVPILIVLPVMLWLDRVEPEPMPALIHSFLWGATVAVLISGIVNTIVAVSAGEVAAAVVSAPLIEEAMKAGGVIYALRRREIDGVMDGIVYAGWVALGFAVVEDITYFAESSDSGVLAQTFVIRALFGPFAHPLFTAWTGLAIGRAVSLGKPVFPHALWGYAAAVGSHALWNGSLSAAAAWGDSGVLVLLTAVVVFVTLFFTSVVVLYRTRRKEERRLVQLVPWLAQRYGMPADEIAQFGNFQVMLAVRKRLPRDQRGQFDAVHAALARLAVLHDRPGPTDVGTEQVLVAQLVRARTGQRQ